MATRKRDKPNVLDAEQIGILLESRAYSLIRKRIEQTLAVKLSDLKQPKDEKETAHLRGFISALELSLTIPKILIAEGKKDVPAEDAEG